MLYIIPAWLASLIAAYWLGYFIRGLTKRIEQLEKTIKNKADKQPEVEEPTSTVIDPYDEVQTAVFEHEQLMKKLNPK